MRVAEVVVSPEMVAEVGERERERERERGERKQIWKIERKEKNGG